MAEPHGGFCAAHHDQNNEADQDRVPAVGQGEDCKNDIDNGKHLNNELSGCRTDHDHFDQPQVHEAQEHHDAAVEKQPESTDLADGAGWVGEGGIVPKDREHY